MIYLIIVITHVLTPLAQKTAGQLGAQLAFFVVHLERR